MIGGGLGDFMVGLALMLVIEGSLWCLFPGPMRRASKAILGMDTTIIRGVGLAVVAVGVCLVWLVRH
jgi:uncharacterized protein YjeT (DUF2065 family)